MSGTGVTPTGSVTFYDGSTALDTATLDGSGDASFTTSILTGGSHTITAVYGGDGNYNSSTLSAVDQTVNQAASTTALTSSENPATFGDDVTFTATVSSSAGTPTGTVTFMDGASTLGTGALGGGGVATFSTTALTEGPHTITAEYGGDTDFADSEESAALPVNADDTVWTDKTGDGKWSTAGNWDNGLPNATNIAVFNGDMSQAICKLDNSVRLANRIVAGLQTDNDYTGTLKIVGVASLTVSSTSAANTGFQWDTNAKIYQSNASNVLIITGGGSETNNVWSNGIIGSGSNQSNLYINGGSTLQITEGALALGDNIIIGQDTNGGSTLEFYNQSCTLQVNNNSGIKVSDDLNYENPLNQILFDTNTTLTGHINQGLGTTSADSFIDNYGTIMRSNAGTYQTGLPIRNEMGTYYPGVLDLQSNLYVSGYSANKTANSSVDQEGGTTILENGATLQTGRGFLQNSGQLLTYGADTATISTSGGVALTITGGSIDISADNHALYGKLAVNGGMSWTGGTFYSYVNGGTAGQQTQLSVTAGSITLGTGAHLQVTSVGALTSSLTWSPVIDNSWILNTLTFDSGAEFSSAYTPGGNPTSIQATSN